MAASSVLLLFAALFVSTLAQDPCSDAVALDDLGVTTFSAVGTPCDRSVSNQHNINNDRGQDTFCDKSGRACSGDPTILDWFYYSSGGYIPTQPPPTLSCGTDAPGWVNGELPALGETVTRTLCYHWSGDTCRWSTPIDIKQCPAGRFVYKQTPMSGEVPACSLYACSEPIPAGVVAPASDPCDEAVALDDQGVSTFSPFGTPCNRSVSNPHNINNDRGQDEFCDRPNSACSGDPAIFDWFYYSSGNYIPNYAPPRLSCGTDAPGWVRGELPALGEQVTRELCYHWTSAECQWSTPIEVKQCPGGKFVYKQTPMSGAIPGCSMFACSEAIPDGVVEAIIRGDPHFSTFDGLMHHFMGLSGVWYTAVQVTGDGQKTVKVEIQTQECGGSFQCLDAARLLVDDAVVLTIRTHGVLAKRVRGGDEAYIVSNVTTDHYKLSFQDNNMTHVRMPSGLQFWVRGMWMKVEVPRQFKNRVSGLLGTFNGDHTDDLTAQHGEIHEFDRHAVEQFVDAKASVPVQHFGHSWISRNASGGLGHKKFGVQSVPDNAVLLVNYTRGDVHNSVRSTCQSLVMKTLQQKCGDVPWAQAEKYIITCEFDLNVCPDCVDMVVDNAELHCH